MKYHKIYSIITLSALMLGFQACSSDPEDEPTPKIMEDSYTVARRELCKRYNLPEDKIMSLNSFYCVGKDNIVVFFTGTNNLNEASIIICDTIVNKALYSNFNQIQFHSNVDFSMPYGEKRTLPFNAFQVCGFAINDNNVAGAYCGLYGEPGATSQFAFLHFHLLYNNEKMTIVELPQSTETLFQRERVKPWHNGGSIFYFGRDQENPDFKQVTCYDSNSNLCYEAQYPYFYEDYTYYDLFNAALVQPISNDSGIGVEMGDGTLRLFAINVMEHTLLWKKKDVVIDSYEHNTTDRAELTNQAYKNDILTFTVEVTTYGGSKMSYNVAVTANGDVSFPKN
ncbi:MAG: hypothetical protein OSJ24_03420 [Muribaculaceae bacterium]|nr:hypothetical protein [Muribaculaceae bacterium]